MSNWTHTICDTCWSIRNPDREPVRVLGSEEYETCCYCGQETNSGIYVRDAPNNPGFCRHEEE